MSPSEKDKYSMTSYVEFKKQNKQAKENKRERETSQETCLTTGNKHCYQSGGGRGMSELVHGD